MSPIAVFIIIASVVAIGLPLFIVSQYRWHVAQRKLAAERTKNPSSPSPPPRYNAKNIRNIRIGYVLSILIFTGMIFIPDIYTLRAKIPPFEELQVTSGEFTYQDVGKRGEKLTGIRTTSGVIYFTCATFKFDHPDCFHMSEYEKLVGKPSTVWWYEQPIYLFMTQKKLVQLIVADEEKISRNNTVRITILAARDAPWFIFVVLVMFSSLVFGFERKIRRQEDEQQTS